MRRSQRSCIRRYANRPSYLQSQRCSRLNLLAMDDNYRAELPAGYVAGFDAWTREPRPLGMLAPPPAEALAMMTVGDQERFDEGEMARIGGLPAWDDLAWAAWVRQR